MVAANGAQSGNIPGTAAGAGNGDGTNSSANSRSGSGSGSGSDSDTEMRDMTKALNNIILDGEPIISKR